MLQEKGIYNYSSNIIFKLQCQLYSDERGIYSASCVQRNLQPLTAHSLDYAMEKVLMRCSPIVLARFPWP